MNEVDLLLLTGILYAIGGVGILVIFGVLATREARGRPSRALFPDRSVPAALEVALLCLCFPFPFIAWIPLWVFEVRRLDGTTWPVPWKVAFTLSPVVSLGAVAGLAMSLGLRPGSQTGLSLLVPLGPLVLAIVDRIVHRRPGTRAA